MCDWLGGAADPRRFKAGRIWGAGSPVPKAKILMASPPLQGSKILMQSPGHLSQTDLQTHRGFSLNCPWRQAFSSRFQNPSAPCHNQTGPEANRNRKGQRQKTANRQTDRQTGGGKESRHCHRHSRHCSPPPPSTPTHQITLGGA